MPISQDKLAQIINHNAKTLCNPKGQRKLNEMAGALPKDENGMVSDKWDNWNFDDPTTPQQSQPQQFDSQISESRIANSRIPDAIKQSILNNPINQSGAFAGAPSADLSFLNKQPINEQANIVQQTTTAPQYQPQQYATPYVPQAAPAIDYNYLKHIIGECIAEYFAKQPINEQSTLKSIGLAEGKIKIVDNKGNVYGATLELKGNLNDKKK